MRILAVIMAVAVAVTVFNRWFKSMDRESVPTVVLGFFIVALAIVFVAVISKAYSKWGA